MAFKCACFISYPHNAGKSVDKFVTRLKEELQDKIAQFVPDPILTDHDFVTGTDFHKKIAKTICESACQEYIAMQRLQMTRYSALPAPVYQRKAFCAARTPGPIRLSKCHARRPDDPDGLVYWALHAVVALRHSRRRDRNSARRALLDISYYTLQAYVRFAEATTAGSEKQLLAW